MAKLRVPQKAQRVLELLIGLGHPRVREALASHGFTDADLDEGWRRLRGLSDVTSLLAPELPSARLLAELDAWENHWFPLVEVVLRTRHPRARDVVFHNLRQTTGAQVVVSVSTLLDRLDALPRPELDGGLGEEGNRARAILRARGLTDQVVADARDLLAQVGAPPERDTSVAAPGTRDAAEQHLWRWYIEWSSIARIAIQDRRPLSSLGLRRPGKKRGGGES